MTRRPFQTDQRQKELCDMSYQAFAPHELPALHSPTQYPWLHTFTRTHKNKQIHYYSCECQSLKNFENQILKHCISLYTEV